MPESGSAIRPSEAARPHTGSAGNPKLPPPPTKRLWAEVGDGIRR